MGKQKWDVWSLVGELAQILRRAVSEKKWLSMQGDRSLWRVPVGITKELVEKVCEDDDLENVDVWVVKGKVLRLSSKSVSLAVASDVLSLIDFSDQQLHVLIAPVHLRQHLLCQLSASLAVGLDGQPSCNLGTT